MAKTIVYDYDALNSTAEKFAADAEDFKSAGTQLLAALESATANWEGASKDKFISAINGTVKTYVETTLPNAVKQYSDVLKEDAKAMQTADQDVADGITI